MIRFYNGRVLEGLAVTENEVWTDGDVIAYVGPKKDETPPFERERYYKILEEILLPAVREIDSSDEKFQGKLEIFLTCRALAGHLRRLYPKDNRGKFLEEASLRLINRTHLTVLNYAETMMMLNSLPPILSLPYPIVADVQQNCVSFVRQIMENQRVSLQWEEFVDMGNYLELLLAFNRDEGLRTSVLPVPSP